MDLDSAYALALLSEELGDSTLLQNNSSSSYKRSAASVTARSLTKITDDKRPPEPIRSSPAVEDRWSALHAYRKSKGLCFVRGEKWAREHKCQQQVQLHVV